MVLLILGYISSLESYIFKPIVMQIGQETLMIEGLLLAMLFILVVVLFVGLLKSNILCLGPLLRQIIEPLL